MPSEARIVAEVLDGVGLLTLCGAGTANIVTPAMLTSLSEAVERFGMERAVHTVVLTGKGHVAFGTDAPEADVAEREAGQDAIRRLAAMPKPVIARIRGNCFGVGLALALAADIRLAAADSAFSLAADRALELDAVPLLVQAIGSGQANYMLLTGVHLDARAAHRLGLVHRVTEDADLSDEVADLARLLADMPHDALRQAKRASRG